MLILIVLFTILFMAFISACVSTAMAAVKGVVNAIEPPVPPPVPPRPYSPPLDEPDATVRYLRARKAEREADKAELHAWLEDLDRRLNAKYK